MGLVGACIWHRSFHFGRKPGYQVFVVLQMAKLGDMVCTTPMFRAIKAWYPQARVIVVGNTSNEQVLAGNPDVDRYIVFHKEHLGDVAKEITKERPDWAFMTSPGFDGLACLLLSDACRVVAPVVAGGRCPHQTISYRLLRILATVVLHRMGHYAPQEYLNLLAPAGIHSADTSKHLTYTPQGNQRVTALLIEHGIDLASDLVIGISPSAGNKIKNWPTERFARVAEKLIERHHAKIVVIGGPADTAEVTGMMSALRDTTRVANFAQQLTIDELKALVAKLHLLIAVDTGPIYIAEACGVPTIDIAGAIDVREQAPRGPRHVNVVPPEPRIPQLHIMNTRVYNTTEVRRQIESVTVDMVLDAFTDLEKLVL